MHFVKNNISVTKKALVKNALNNNLRQQRRRADNYKERTMQKSGNNHQTWRATHGATEPLQQPELCE